MGLLRLFAAVEVPGGIAARVAMGLRGIRTKYPQVQWAREGPMHLTLLFLGDQDEGSVPRYLEAFRRIASRGASFSMELGGLDAFPNLGKPKVLFAPALAGAMEFSGLSKTLAQEATGAGLAPGEEREVRAHLTLGRLRDGKAPPGLLEDLRDLLSPSLGAFRVERFFLFQSRSRPSGAVHTKLGEIALGRG